MKILHLNLLQMMINMKLKKKKKNILNLKVLFQIKLINNN